MTPVYAFVASPEAALSFALKNLILYRESLTTPSEICSVIPGPPLISGIHRADLSNANGLLLEGLSVTSQLKAGWRFNPSQVQNCDV